VNTVEDLRQVLSDDVRRLQPPAGLETRVLQRALKRSGAVVLVHRAERRNALPSWEPTRRTELAAGIAAILLAAIVIGSFAYIRAAIRPHTFAPPITSPSPTLTRPLNVDPAAPVILFTDAGNRYQVDGMTWDGQSGKITQVPRGGPNSLTAESSNPAGTLFVAFPNIIDRSGRVVAKLGSYPSIDMFLGTWADDERHYCQVGTPAPGANLIAGTLQLTTPGGSPRDVVQVGDQGPDGSTFEVPVCSVLGDRAVVIQSNQNFIQYWVVQLSSGLVLWTRNHISTCPPPAPTVNACGIPNVVASRDGRYVAEIQPTGVSTVFGPNGSPVGYVNGFVNAFSWDGSLVVVSGMDTGQARLIKWNDGAVIWAAPPAQIIAGLQPEPGGTSLAILLMSNNRSTLPPPGVLYVVSSDGRVLGRGEVGSSSLLACRPGPCGGGGG
jgi:hypothetical protein